MRVMYSETNRASKNTVLAMLVVCATLSGFAGGCVGNEDDLRILELENQPDDADSLSAGAAGPDASLTEMIAEEPSIDSPTTGCECDVSARDTSCDYIFLPPSSMCEPASSGQGTAVYAYHYVVNSNETQNLYLYCSVGDYYIYHEGYNQTASNGVLSSVKVYYQALGVGDVYTTAYLAVPDDDAISDAGGCGASGSGAGACLIDLDPETDEFFTTFRTFLGDANTGAMNYILGYRLCFDPDGDP